MVARRLPSCASHAGGYKGTPLRNPKTYPCKDREGPPLHLVIRQELYASRFTGLDDGGFQSLIEVVDQVIDRL